MPSKTLTRSKTITDAKIAVATLALLGALEISLVAAPAQGAPQKALVRQAPACAAQITNALGACRLRGGVVGYRDYRFTCPSGKKYKMVAGCRSKVDAQARVDPACVRNRQCNAPAPVVAPTPAFPDMAFVGGATFYTDAEGRYKVKLRYTNRGSVDLDPQNRNNYRFLVTALNDQQQPDGENVQSEDLYPLSAGQVFDMTWNPIAEAPFVKFELQIGENINDQSIDRDLTNNVMIVPVPARPFPNGVDPRPEHGSDIRVSVLRVVSSTVSVTVTNDGDSQFAPLENGAQVQLLGRNQDILSSTMVALPALAAHEATLFSVPFNGITPELISVYLDPENQGNETRLVFPNLFLENNRLSVPLTTPPALSWSGDTPSGASSPGMGQLVGKLVISNSADDPFPLEVNSLRLQIQTDIQVSPENRRYLKIYKDGIHTEPLVSTIWDPEMRVFHLQEGMNFEVNPGASKTLFITLDTVDARADNYLSLRVAPIEGFGWSKEQVSRWGSSFVNSPELVFKTFTY